MSSSVPPDPAVSSGRETQQPSGNLPVPVRDGEVLRPAHDNWLLRAIRTLFGWRSDSLRADLQVVLEASTPDESSFSATERAMLRNILNMRERRIVDVMIPRADIIAVKLDTPLGELMKLFESAAHSRLVVYRDTLDDPEGMVHIRDLLAYVTSRAQVDPDANTRRKRPFPANLDLRSINLSMPLSSLGITRKLLYVPPSMPALDLLAQMQATRIHLALVVDEYGGSDGLVSIEDLVEQIVGEIDDEHDSAEPPSIVRQPDNSFIADARAPIEDVVTLVGEQFDIGEAADAIDTLGGYLVAHVGRLPLRGEVISGPGPFEIEVLDADPRRVKRLRISLRKEPPPPSPRAREPRRRDATPDAPAKPESPDATPASDAPPGDSARGT